MLLSTPPLGLTFDDVLLEPQESNITPAEVDVATKITKHINLATPVLSAAMDTVTEAALAIALQREGGLGILHRNCSVADQVKMVRAVKKHKLIVGAAVGPYDIERAHALDKAGADLIVIDAAHIHKPAIVESAKKIKKLIGADLMVGNIATAKAASAFINVADALKVGVGPGAICTTRIVAGVGVPQLTAIINVAAVAKRRKIPVVADGGIRYSGDAVKALAVGASAVMLGSMFAGTNEAPGDIIKVEGKSYKRYRGMGSLGAMNVGQSSDRYAQENSKKYVPEGVEGITPAKGSVHNVVFHLLGGLKSGFGYVGAKNIAALQKRARFIRITEAGRAESHPHSITIEKEAPNYH